MILKLIRQARINNLSSIVFFDTPKECNAFFDTLNQNGIPLTDLQVYDDTLVVLTDHQLPNAFVEKIVAKSWRGSVEVYCTAELMIGA